MSVGEQNVISDFNDIVKSFTVESPSASPLCLQTTILGERIYLPKNSILILFASTFVVCMEAMSLAKPWQIQPHFISTLSGRYIGTQQFSSFEDRGT